MRKKKGPHLLDRAFRLLGLDRCFGLGLFVVQVPYAVELSLTGIQPLRVVDQAFVHAAVRVHVEEPRGGLYRLQQRPLDRRVDRMGNDDRVSGTNLQGRRSLARAGCAGEQEAGKYHSTLVR